MRLNAHGDLFLLIPFFISYMKQLSFNTHKFYRMENYSFPSVGLLCYPVGNDMKIAANFTKAAAWQFNKIKEYNNQSLRLNLWCRGSSGAILASLFSINIDHTVKIIHVKKPGENSHTSNHDPYTDWDVINVIIDDFTSSGQTLHHIYSQMGALNILTVDALIIQRLGRFSATEIEDRLGFCPRYLISDFR